MAVLIPRKGVLRYLNPGPFNSKEHAAICIMASSAAGLPEAMIVLSVQRLYYNIIPNPFAAIMMIIACQMLGYGVAGLLRSTLVYPTKMLWPENLPIASLIDSLHREKAVTKKKMRVFYYGFAALFLWSAFPQYIMPILGGISVACLAAQDNMIVSRLFGGVMANEGMGFLSISLDWATIAAGHNPLWLPLQTLLNEGLGVCLGYLVFSLIYYGNVWNARNLPFISPMLYSAKSNSTHYIPYNQTAILNRDHLVDEALVEKMGLPYWTGTYVMALIMSNIAVLAAVVHLLLWHWDDMKSVWAWMNGDFLRKLINPRRWDLKFWKRQPKQLSYEEAKEIDPHYALMQNYKEVPGWWFGLVFVLAAVTALICLDIVNTTLPWWGFFAAISIMSIALPFFSAMTALTGYGLFVQSLIQIIGAYLVPGRPLANMYFATFGFNSMMQAKHLLSDLKLGQYVHLEPRCTFTMQVFGTVMGSIVSYVVSQSIVEDKKEILLAVQGTNVWSGTFLQAVNGSSIAWGGLAKHLFNFGGRYYIVVLGFLFGAIAPIPLWLIHKKFPQLKADYWNVAIIAGSMAAMGHGSHVGLTMHFAVGFASQLWLRKYRPTWFTKYNYILSASLDGGMSVISFILTFSVLGAAGKTVDFPPYWGNNYQHGNYDYCAQDPALARKGGKEGAKPNALLGGHGRNATTTGASFG